MTQLEHPLARKPPALTDRAAVTVRSPYNMAVIVMVIRWRTLSRA